MNSKTQSYHSIIGIDIPKETLDVYHLPSEKYTKIENNKKDSNILEVANVNF
jgi:hypothetical protein